MSAGDITVYVILGARCHCIAMLWFISPAAGGNLCSQNSSLAGPNTSLSLTAKGSTKHQV